MAKMTKRAKVATVAFEGKMNITVEEAVKLIKGAATAKFDETLEIALNYQLPDRLPRLYQLLYHLLPITVQLHE